MDSTVPPSSVVDGQLAAEPSPPGMRRRRSVDELLLLRPHRICSCRQPPVSAFSSPLPGAGGDLGESKMVGVLAEKFHLSAHRSESSPELLQILLEQASGSKMLVISLGCMNLLRLLDLGVSQPLLVIYKYSHNLACPLCALPKMIFCKYFGRSSSSSSRECTPMGAPSIAMLMNFGPLPLHPTLLCSIVSRVLPKLLGLSAPCLLKKTLLLIDTTLGILPELPEDILMHVFATLEIPDLVRAGSVCTLWQSAYTALRNLGKHKQTQTPCLLYTSESAGEKVACLYSLVEKRVYRLTLPEPPLRSRFLIGSSLGFLVTVDDRSEMHLVNPITRQQIALPSVTTMPHVKPIFDDSGALHQYEYSRNSAKRSYSSWIHAPGELREHFHFKAYVFYDTYAGSFIVVLIHQPFSQLSFARVGDDKWTSLPPQGNYQDCTYKDGLLYAATIRAEIHAYDLSGPTATMEIIRGVDMDLHLDAVYIVQAPWDGLLLVSRSIEIEDPDPDADSEIPLPKYTVEVKLHKVDVGTMRLVEIDCLPDHVLFLGHSHTLCLSAKEHPALKGNHAYFTDDDEYITGRKSCRRDIGVVDLGSNSKEEFVSPQIWSNWPAPVWITPNLTMMKLALKDYAQQEKVAFGDGKIGFWL